MDVDFNSDLSERLRELRLLNNVDRQKRIERLTQKSPINPWPYGMPMAVAPYVVLLGPSPGSSRKAGDSNAETRGHCGTPPVCGSAPEGFRYEDTKGYWQKASDLCTFLVGRKSKMPSEDALSLSGALDLGTGQHGSASLNAIEPEVVRWVSELLNTAIAPTIIVAWGLWGLIRQKEIMECWNHPLGLRVDWTSPQREMPVTNGLKLRFWRSTRSDGRHVAVLMWPNHPSRVPYGGGPEGKAWNKTKYVADTLLRDEGF